MRIMRHVAVVLFASAAPAGAQALSPEPAPAGTADGARSVADGLVPYLGRAAFDGGVVKVEPDPAGYRLTVDPKPLLAGFSDGATEVRISPYSFVVSRRDDGNWNYFSNSSLDVAVRTVVDGASRAIEYEIGPQQFRGVYSPAVAAFLSGAGNVDNLAMIMTEPSGEVAASFGRATFDLVGTPVGDGVADVSVKQRVDGFSETVVMKEGPDTPPGGLSFTFKAGNVDLDFGMTAARSRQIADLYSFFVTHPEFVDPKTDKATLAAGQDELKAKLRGALPLWNRLESAYRLSGIEVDTRLGSAKANSMTLAMKTDGVSRSGSFSYAFGFDGLNLSAPMVPTWAAALVPQEMDLRMRVDNLDLQTPSDIAIADLDLGRAEPITAEAQGRIADSFATTPPRFVFEPSRIKSRDLDVAMAGSFAVSAGRPAVTMDITAGGVEKTISTLQAAAQNDPSIHQIVGGLSMAKGFGKTLPDGRVQWIVDASSDGSVKINGFEVKGPDPVISAPDDGLGEDGVMPDGGVLPDEPPTDDSALPETAPQ